MKNNIKKIITLLSFAFLLFGTSALASVSWNEGDCPGSAIGNATTGVGVPSNSNDCWNLSSVSAVPGNTINVQEYYHNTGTSTATNAKLFITVSPALGQVATVHTFTSSISSDQGTTSFGTTQVTLSSPQALTFGSTYWYPNQSNNYTSTGSSILTSSGLSLGSITPGWSSQGSAVVSFQVGNSTPPPTCSITNFSASPNSITSGGSSTLSWNTNGCTSASISNIGSVNTSGSSVVTPAVTTTYTLTAYGSSGGQQTQSVTVTVNQQQNCIINNFSASPTSINSGSYSTLTWSTTNCSSVTISNLGYNVPTSGTQQVYPVQTTTYTLTAYGSSGGQQTQSVTVTVNQQQTCSITSFTANGSTSTTIQSGSSATLAWNTTNCTSVAISPNIGGVNNSGSMVVTPLVTTTYTLTAYGSGYWAQQTQSVTVNVTQIQNNCTISYFNASPTSINSGGTSTLSWNTNNCTSVTISNLGYNVPLSGSQVIYPTYTTTYVLTAYGTSGIQQTQSVTVSVNNYQNNCTISYFNASPTYVNTGGSSTLSWNTYNCNSVSISNLGYSVLLSGSQIVYPTYTTTYVLTAYGTNGGQQTQSVTVSVNNYNYNNCYISYFSASPTSINSGGSSTLTWSTSNCTSVSISNLTYNISTAGTQVVYPTGTTTYTLTAYGQNYGSTWAQQTQSVTVFVNPYINPNPVVSCAVTTIPTNVTQSSATLNGMLTSGGSYNTYFEYGSTADLGFQTTARSSNGSTSFSDVISGLPSGTVYYFRLVSNCGNNGISRGDLKVFQTLASYVKPIIIGPTVIGTSSPIMLKIENNSQSIRIGDTIYYTVTYKNIGGRTLTHPMIQVVIPDGITFISSSQGTYQEASKTLSVPLNDLNAGDQGTISLVARVDALNSNNSQIVTTAILIYTNGKGAQENAIAYVLNNPEGSTSSLGALALFSGFWGLGLIGWLLIIIIILLIILIYRKYFYRKPYSTTTTTTHTIDTHSDNHI